MPLHSLSWSTEGTRNALDITQTQVFVLFLDINSCWMPPSVLVIHLSSDIKTLNCVLVLGWLWAHAFHMLPLLPLADLSKVRAVMVWPRKPSGHFTLSVRNYSLRWRLREWGRWQVRKPLLSFCPKVFPLWRYRKVLVTVWRSISPRPVPLWHEGCVCGSAAFPMVLPSHV